jgi:replication-associated recombination protein RarA
MFTRDPTSMSPLQRLRPASEAYWLGTDHLGRDVLSRVIFGARVSMSAGLLIVAFSLLIGLPVGLLAGYFGGLVDGAMVILFDIISAFIKSIRGSDPQAAVYWLARMIHGGEDAKFIARRMLILASEDIGNANPTAMILANNTFQAVHQVGMPESRIILSQCAIYLACSTKSNSSYLAIDLALEEVRKNPNLEVPLHLRNSPTKLMKQLGYGEGYLYAHHYENNFVKQSFLPSELENQEFFTPGKNPREQEMQQFLDKRWGKGSSETK